MECRKCGLLRWGATDPVEACYCPPEPTPRDGLIRRQMRIVENATRRGDRAGALIAMGELRRLEAIL